MKAPPDKPYGEMSVSELAAAIRYHNWRYFTLAQPVISDPDFDELTRLLSAIEPGHSVLAELTSDAQAIGTKITHSQPMLSLDKCYEGEEFRNWLLPKRGRERVRAFVGDFIETPKIDGVAASFRYDASGRLSLATTRGDGVQGESFLANARHIAELPNQLSGPPLAAEIEVRGELYLKLSTFEGLGGDFSNPRNTTAGAIKQKDPRKTADYGLSFFVYDVIGPTFETEMAKVEWAREHGLEPVETRLLGGVEDVERSFLEWQDRRAELDFETDGVVYKVNDIREQTRMGATAHHPRFAIAYKFRGDSGVTTLQSVEWSVSRTGVITPVAIVEGIFLSGAMVTRCSLHNLSILGDLGLTLGAQVTAMRRGGVIPHIENVVSPGEGEIEVPTRCPSCDQPTVIVDDFLRCTAPESCVTAVLGTLEHFVKGVGIDGFGPKIIEQLNGAGLLLSPADFYRLESAQWLQLDRMGEKLATRLLANVDAGRRLPLAHFLRALGIQDLGDVASKTLAQHFRTMDRVLEATTDELASIDGFGEKTSQGIVSRLREKRPVIDDLRQFVVVEDQVSSAPAAASGHPLFGLSVVFTGKLQLMGRHEAQHKVRTLGGKTPSGISASLNILVIGDEDSPLTGDGRMSSKHKKAQAFIDAGSTLRIMSESDFVVLLETEASEGDPGPGSNGPSQGSLF